MTLGWNGRGVGQPAAVQNLVCLVQTHRPSLVFICKTRESKQKVRNLRLRIGMSECFAVKGEQK
jgi:hypothetical protein